MKDLFKGLLLVARRMGLSSSPAWILLLSEMLVWLAGQPVEAAELREETIAAFDRYIGASERRIQSELHNGPFLFVDELGEKRRAEGYAQLREGQVLVKQMNTKEEGHPIEVPHGLIHDWIGVVFIPKVALAQTLAVVQDYDNHQKIYGPEVRHSRLLQHNGDNFKVFLQLYKKSLVTVVIDADFDIHYERFGTNRAVSRSYSTRLVEVEGVGRADQHELPVDDAHGYIWRLYSYWRFEEKDGGVYVQLESIGLSRTVPAIIGWLLNPLLSSIPRGILSSLLRATRAAVTNLSTKASSPGKGELCSPGSRRPHLFKERSFPGLEIPGDPQDVCTPQDFMYPVDHRHQHGVGVISTGAAGPRCAFRALMGSAIAAGSIPNLTAAARLHSG